MDGKNYHISRRGRLYRYYPNRGVWMVFNGTISRGRVYHILRNSTSRIRIQASRLVALAYIPNPDNKPCVCHKDNNPLNNHYKNLYWGTHQENMAQMIVDGRKQKGEECPRWVNKEIPELFDYYCDGVSTMELAEMFNTNKSMINKIIRYKFKELWQGRK